jgi:hypothetical protein
VQAEWQKRALGYGPRCEDPARALTHWDYLLKEAHWLAKDMGQVRGRPVVQAQGRLQQQQHQQQQQKQPVARLLLHICLRMLHTLLTERYLLLCGAYELLKLKQWW